MAQVRLRFNDGTYNYTLPHVFALSDPKEGMKATTIRGNRGDGSIIIPGGKQSQEIRVRGRFCAEGGGYITLTSKMNEMRTKVTTKVATLTLEHKSGVTWITDWEYTCRRISEIRFPESLRTSSQEYECVFLVFSY